MITTHKSRMRSIALIITLGVILVLLPALGFPSSIDDKLIFIIGAVLIVMGVLIRRGMLPKEESIFKPHDVGEPKA